jgi:hypothetical protein
VLLGDRSVAVLATPLAEGPERAGKPLRRGPTDGLPALPRLPPVQGEAQEVEGLRTCRPRLGRPKKTSRVFPVFSSSENRSRRRGSTACTRCASSSCSNGPFAGFHNLIIGDQHDRTMHSGVASGYQNSIGAHAVALGSHNDAVGTSSTVYAEDQAGVTGGFSGWADRRYAVVSAGADNAASPEGRHHTPGTRLPGPEVCSRSPDGSWLALRVVDRPETEEYPGVTPAYPGAVAWSGCRRPLGPHSFPPDTTPHIRSFPC